MRELRHPIVLAAAAALLAVALLAASDGLELKAPWSGVSLVASAMSLVFAGYLLRRALKIIALALALAAGLLLLELTLASDAGDAQLLDSGSCDPTCGISAGGAAMLVFLTVLILAGVGGLIGEAMARR